VAFTLILLAPTLVGAAALAGLGVMTPGSATATGAGQGDAIAGTAVRSLVAARCRDLSATATSLAATASAAGQSFAVVPAGSSGAWAICGVDPAELPAAAQTGLAARVEIRHDGVATGEAYAVQPLDDAFLAELSAAAGRRVSLADASGSRAYGQISNPIASDATMPLRLRMDAASPAGRGPLTVLLVVAGAAVVASALLGWWLASLATRPLRRLLAAVDRASTGDLTARTAVRGRDETGRLGLRLDGLLAGLQETQRLSVTDALTGLGNRRALAEHLHREIERAGRFGRTFGVLALDLDHFKEINDSHGHRVGDGVLVELAARIRGVIREVDLAFRQGGEEFVVLLPETDIAGSLTAARRIGDAVRDTPFARDDEAIAVTVSAGVAVFPRHARTGEDLLEAADQALYAAKAAGRDTFVLAGTQPQEDRGTGSSHRDVALGALR
jgi:diguanylate cyclase (GGDEF)-like protein